jgi:hypothetical protein
MGEHLHCRKTEAYFNSDKPDSRVEALNPQQRLRVDLAGSGFGQFVDEYYLAAEDATEKVGHRGRMTLAP